jgi:hypothetical protein
VSSQLSGKIALVVFWFGISTISMIMMRLPILVTQTLDMGRLRFGIAQGVMKGGVLAGILEKKLTIKNHVGYYWRRAYQLLIPAHSGFIRKDSEGGIDKSRKVW